MMRYPSTPEDLQNAIRSDNPFNKGLVVATPVLWGEGLLDLPDLNNHADHAVFAALEQVRQNDCCVGITIRGEKGLGKTHLIGRIRRRLQATGGAWFIYMSDYSDLNRIKSEVLNSLASSLQRNGSKEVTQWQELATDLINESLQKNNRPQETVAHFAKLPDKQRILNQLTDKVLEVKSDADPDPDLVKAVLWRLSRQHAPFAIKWIAGKGLSRKKAEEMDLPDSQEENQDSEALERICKILDLIGSYNPFILCFDQLEGVEVNDAGFTKAQVIATFAMDLYNRIRAGVILTTVYEGIWNQEIRSIPNANAVIDRIGEKIVDLNYINSDNAVALVACKLKSFYETKGLIPHSPTYPFEESRLRERGKQRATARNLLRWCRDHWNVPIDPVASAWESTLESVEVDLEDKGRIGKAMVFGLNQLIGETLEGVTIEKIEPIKSPKQEAGYCLDFKIIGRENGQTVKIGVMVLQASAGRTVTAGLKRLGDYNKYDLTRGCLVRSKQISKIARKAQQLSKELLGQKGGEWVMLKSEAVKPLLAMLALYNSRDDYDVSEEQIFAYISQERIALDNPLPIVGRRLTP